MVMDLEGGMTVVPMPTQSSNYLHESSTKLKLMANNTHNTHSTHQQQPQPQQQLPEDHSQAAPAGGIVVSRPVHSGGYDATASAVAAAAAAVAATMASGGGGGAAAAAATNNGNSNVNNNSTSSGSKKPVRYRECQKNHAAGIGGHALDGCGEFLPSGEEGTIEALKCSACDCHRNFHRREVEGETPPPCPNCWYNKSGAAAGASASKDGVKKKPASLLSPLATITPGANTVRSPTSLMTLSSDQSDEQDGGGVGGGAAGAHHGGFSMAHHHHMNASGIKKRFRTKFTNDQKERMYQFADRLGWRIQKHDEADVQQFCAEVGVKRHVLKVWMHNNKNTYGKKL